MNLQQQQQQQLANNAINNNNIKRQSFHQSKQTQIDRKPEELDAVANDLLNEFVLKPKPSEMMLRHSNIKSNDYESPNSGESSSDEDELANVRDDGTLPVSHPSSKPLSM